MDVKDYRREYEASLAQAAKGAAGPSPTLGFAFSGAQPDTFDLDILRNLRRLADAAAAVPERRAALNSLKAARFSGPRFARYRSEFLDTLRGLLRPGEDPALRIDVAEVLASEKDRPTQELLRQGLEDQAKALVPPAEALEFLGYDDHEDAGGLALEVLRTSADLPAREAALRVLGTAPGAADVFAAAMGDKSEAKSLRALGAIGLSRTDPDRFADVAAKVVMDEGDYPDIRATTLGALAGSPNLKGRLDPSIVEGIRSLSTEAVPEMLQSAAERFLRHGG